VKRGEVWWREAPGKKRRPVCIITRDQAIPVLSEILVVPATTNRRGIGSEVPLDHDDGMPKPCVLSLDNVALAHKSHLTERITELSPMRMNALCEALHFTTTC
jgi:mRNA interferase MazF